MRAPPRPAHGWKAEVETRRSRPPAAVGACARGQTRMRRARCAVRGSQIAQAADTAASRKEGHPAVGSGPAPVARRPHVSAESDEAARSTWTALCPWNSGPPAGASRCTSRHGLAASALTPRRPVFFGTVTCPGLAHRRPRPPASVRRRTAHAS